MKSKLLIMAALCAIAFTANAQTEKGKILIGGEVSFIAQKLKSQTNIKNTNFTAGPAIGFFIADNFVIGTSLNYSYDKNDPIIYSSNSSMSGDKYTSLGLAPYARYYTNISNSFKFFGQLTLRGDFGHKQFIDAQGVINPDKIDYKSYAAIISPGLAFFPSKKIAIQLSIPLINYMHQTSEAKYANKTTFNAFTFAATTSPSLGVNFHF